MIADGGEAKQTVMDTCPWRVGMARGHINVTDFYWSLNSTLHLVRSLGHYLAWEFVNNLFRNFPDLPHSSFLTFLADSRSV